MISYDRLIRNPDIVRQPPTFFRKGFINEVGGLNADLYLVMDYDLWVRLAKMSPPKMVDQNWAYFRRHAIQKTTYTNIPRQIDEIKHILRREKAPLNVFWAILLRKRGYLVKGQVKNILLKMGALNQEYLTKRESAKYKDSSR
jgi:hypothetical protein